MLGRRWARSGVTVVTAVVFAVSAGSTAAYALARRPQILARFAAALPAAAPPSAALPATASRAPDAASPALASSSAAAATSSPVASALASPSSSPAGTFRVVGLGDSVPAGSECGCTSYVALVGQQAAQTAGRPAAVTNLAQAGLTTSGLVAQLQQAGVRRVIAAADLVIVTVGANDLDPSELTSPACQPAAGLACYRQALTLQSSRLESALAQVGALAPPGATVLVTGYWNVFLDGAAGRQQGTGYVTASKALTLADNAAIASASSAGGATYVDLYTPFTGDGTADDTGLLAADGDHPNAAGHRLIAQTLLVALT